MGVQHVPTLLIKMSLPMMASMLVMALYNIVDSIFVSRISENALTAVSLVYPFQMLFTSVAVGTGVGVNSLIARRLGEQRQAEADSAAATGQFLALVSAVVCRQRGDFKLCNDVSATVRRALRLCGHCDDG